MRMHEKSERRVDYNNAILTGSVDPDSFVKFFEQAKAAQSNRDIIGQENATTETNQPLARLALGAMNIRYRAYRHTTYDEQAYNGRWESKSINDRFSKHTTRADAGSIFDLTEIHYYRHVTLDIDEYVPHYSQPHRAMGTSQPGKTWFRGSGIIIPNEPAEDFAGQELETWVYISSEQRQDGQLSFTTLAEKNELPISIVHSSY